MSLKKAFNRKGITIYPWYVSDVVATKDIKNLSGGHVIKEAFLYIKDGFTNIFYEKNMPGSLAERSPSVFLGVQKCYPCRKANDERLTSA